MIGLQDIQTILADEFCGGNFEVAGIIIFAFVMMVVFSMFHSSLFGAFAVMIPCTLIFTTLGVLSTTATIVMIIVAVLGLGVIARRSVVD